MAKKREWFRIKGRVKSKDALEAITIICDGERIEQVKLAETLADRKKRRLYERGKIKDLGRQYGKLRYIEAKDHDPKKIRDRYELVKHLLVIDNSNL